jgi:hypothetical protein
MKNTIDEKHSEMISQFSQNTNEIIPQLQDEIACLQEQLKQIKKKSNIDEFLTIKERILSVQKNISVLLEKCIQRLY